MQSGRITAVLTVLALASPSGGTAQATVAFEVPLNLAQIPAGIAKVGVLCEIQSEAIVVPQSLTAGAWTNISNTLRDYTADRLYPMAARQEFWATGSLVATARVVVSLPAEWLNNPVGKSARYGCAVQGFDSTTLKWDFFNEQAVAPWKLKVTPPMYQGDFVW
jgi:hypothetical protein